MRAALLLLASGCTDPCPWGRADITPTAQNMEYSERFQGLVAEAVSEWDLALADRCGGPVLRIVPEGGRPVEEAWFTDWHESDLGYFDGDRVRVLWQPFEQERAVLVHELGHALGLDHVSVAEDPRSVMHPAANGYLWHPTEGDVRLAAAALDCP